MLEIILGFKVPKASVHVEHSILISSDFRSVRLDVYASDELKVGYDIEAQNEDAGNLAKRSRYYQAEMDVSSLKPGDDFSDLRPGYVIFICTFDPNHDESIRQLHDRVLRLKQWRELEGRYMTIEDMLKRKEKISRAEGKAEGLAEGIATGKAEAILELLEDYGTIPEELRETILKERDSEVLSRWHKAAAKVESIEEFLAKM